MCATSIDRAAASTATTQVLKNGNKQTCLCLTHLGRPDPVTAHVDHVIHAPDDPVVPVLVTPRTIAWPGNTQQQRAQIRQHMFPKQAPGQAPQYVTHVTSRVLRWHVLT